MMDSDWPNNGVADWLIGEDFPPNYLQGLSQDYQNTHGVNGQNGAIALRNMAHPVTTADLSINPPCTDANDWCRVHTNSRIPNYAAHLITDGDNNIAGIGRRKAEQIYYKTLRDYLLPTEQLEDAARKTRWGGCEDLIGGQDGVTANDCDLIRQHFTSVGLDTTLYINLIPGWFGAEDQGGGIAVANLDNNGSPEILAMHIDNPAGENTGHYRVGLDCDRIGNCRFR